MTRVDAEILTVEDLAELFGCDSETVAARLISGDLPGVKVGRGWIVPRQALFERLNEKAHQEASARRSELESRRSEAMERGAHPLSVKRRFPSEATTVLDTSSKPRTSRKRREPPPLPALPTCRTS